MFTHHTQYSPRYRDSPSNHKITGGQLTNSSRLHRSNVHGEFATVADGYTWGWGKSHATNRSAVTGQVVCHVSNVGIHPRRIVSLKLCKPECTSRGILCILLCKVSRFNTLTAAVLFAERGHYWLGHTWAWSGYSHRLTPWGLKKWWRFYRRFVFSWKPCFEFELKSVPHGQIGSAGCHQWFR